MTERAVAWPGEHEEHQEHQEREEREEREERGERDAWDEQEDRAGHDGPGLGVDGGRDDDRSSGDLDDHADREELRRRYYGLMQELRVLLPGAQVLVAFLLTAPFANRFGELDRLGTTLYLVALLSGMSAVVLFVTPTAVHRFGRRQARHRRLADAVLVTRVGIVLLGLSLLAAQSVIVRLVAGEAAALTTTIGAAALLGVLWVLVPLRTRHT